METTKLKKFAQFARRSLMDQVSGKLQLVMDTGSAARREQPRAVAELEKQIQSYDKEQVIEKVAYTWFNRFCALRFMDMNRYTRIGVVSPVEGQFQPEILAEAKMGHVDEEMVPDDIAKKIFTLLSGTAPSPDAQSEAYRLLVVAACNFWNKSMPFLFQKIADYTELLMPDDLLSGNSILAYTREAMTPDACEDVEVIGWLYQFYISEKKDEVFDGLKKNKKITPENIPAATQLFTPHWIVRYLVENSLGRLWLLNRPGSKLTEQMDYYIKPEQAETDFLRISKPEEIKICDPACGSGHMLTYAFDLLYAIYEEEGYEPAEIPEKILTNNLYGVEIDERAGELAAFALTMKARAKHRRFFNKGVKPNICVLQNVNFKEGELKEYLDVVGRDLFTAPWQTTLRQFEEADNFGSLIRPEASNVARILKTLGAKYDFGRLFSISMTHQKVLQALRQADYLNPKYHVVIANPPYMGARNINKRLLTFLSDVYDFVKFDTFSAFVARCSQLCLSAGSIGIMSPNVWMYISNHEGLRLFLTENKTIFTLAELPLSGFSGATVQICAYVFQNKKPAGEAGVYIRLTSFKGGDTEMAKMVAIAAAQHEVEYAYKVPVEDFKLVPGRTFAYWTSKAHRHAFKLYPPLSESADVRTGMQTGDNPRFLRFWHEISSKNINAPSNEYSPQKRWYLYAKGGDFRLWYGNVEHVVDWKDEGLAIKNLKVNGSLRSRVREISNYFRRAASWSFISSSYFGCRYKPPGVFFDVAGSSALEKKADIENVLGFLCSRVASTFLASMNPTMNFQIEDIASLPFHETNIKNWVASLVNLSRMDWDAYETSWDFTAQPLLNPDYRKPTLKATYQNLRAHWRDMTFEMRRLEEENNRIFIDAYGLQDELKPEVPLKEITLTCNPHYRYGTDKSEDELEGLLLADTMRELVSYSVGCMFGRYSLDKPGLILSNPGETIEDYRKRVPEPSFPADDDNVIPMLDENWFSDDIAERFRTFLKTAFGEEQFEANLKFIEKALGKDIRKFFLKDFYTDHIKRYKKRPIYWLFSSPKGSFNALIYMHRYRPDTVSTVLQYLRDFRSKLTNHVLHLRRVEASADASKGEKTKALKDIDAYSKVITELDAYERDTLYPLATEQLSIDLDDGVKANYTKFGSALKKIPGLKAKEE